LAYNLIKLSTESRTESHAAELRTDLRTELNKKGQTDLKSKKIEFSPELKTALETDLSTEFLSVI
jgi:hypothetical protein